MTDSTFAQLGLNMIIILNRRGEMVYSSGYDHREAKRIPIPAEIGEHIRAGSLLTNHESIKSDKKGIISLRNGGVILASRPVITSAYSGPIMGTLIMGRNLDEEVLGRWAKLTRTELSLQPLRDIKEAPAVSS
ncbi:MAG: hypothetical protein QG578_2097, partial [Thermodesulfobacteriota bacterium]|nr:hypothetical protein [Thermodesulfobacteriota bacterium]